MGKFVLRRALSAIPVLLGILAVTFALGRAIPGDPCRAVLGERATDQICDAYLDRVGLNEPVTTQFRLYVERVFSGDLGDSTKFGRPVTDLLVQRLPTTIELTAAALSLAVVVGVPLGVISARKQNSRVDVITMMGANAGVSMPVFWLGLMLQFVFAVLLRNTWFSLPPSGRLDAGMIPDRFYDVWGWTANGLFEFLGNFTIFNAMITGQWEVLRSGVGHLILPAVALATIPIAVIARMTRATLLDVLGLDYIRTAQAKGLSGWRVLIGHGLRNALLPVVTVIGTSLGGLLGGAILTETIFSLTGVGRTVFDAITSRDYALIQGFTLVIAVGFVVVNLLVDIAYMYLDPRVRSE